MKRILLILILILIMATSACALSGTYTEYGNFYLPGYAAHGILEWTEYNTYMAIADAQIEANKTTGVDTSGTPEANDIPRFTDLNTIEGLSYTELKTALDLEIGTDIQAYDTTLLSIATLGTAANKIAYTTDVDTWAETALSAYGITLIDDADASTARTTLGIDLSLYYLKTEIDSLSEVETIYTKDIIDSDELTSALADYYLKTAIDTLGEVEAIYTADIIDDTELATALTDYYLKTAIDSQGEMETIWGVSLLNDITGEDFDDLADIPAHPAAATKVLETTVDGYTWIDTPSGGGASELSDLSDVGVTTKTDKFVLVADGDSFESRAISSDDLSDVASIAMLDEPEFINQTWVFTEDFYVRRVSDILFPDINFQRRRDGDPSYNVADDDILGQLYFKGYHTDGYYGGAKIKAVVDGTPSESDMPGRLEFLTTPDASATPALRMAIDNAGNIKMGDGAWTNYVNIDNAGALTFQGTASIALPANSVDSDNYTDASIDHEHLAPDVITGLTKVTGNSADMMIIADQSDSWALKKIDLGEVLGAGGGYTDLTEFVDQTAWRLFYSNADGDVIELALGADGTYLSSNGATSAPTFETGSDKTNWVIPQDYGSGTGTSEDPWTGLAAAYTACPTGGTIYLRAGYYELDAYLGIAKAVNIIGEGMGVTFVITANDSGFWYGSAADYVVLEGLTIDGNAQTDGNSSMRVINFSGTDYATVRNIEVKNGGYYGINIFEVNNCTFQNIYAHDNYRHGVHLGSDTSGRGMYNVCRDIYCWDNGVSGFSDRGADTPPSYPIEDAYSVYDNIQAWDNTQEGIAISQQKSGILSNSFASGNGNKGIAFFGLEEFDIHDCLVNTSTSDGVLIDGCDDLVLTNVIAKNNTENGFNLNNSSGIKFNSCRAYDDRGTKVQIYGLETAGTTDNIELINCDLRGNLTARIANVASATITGTDAHALTEDHDYSGKWKTGVVGETVVYGQLLYHNFADDWKESDADAAATMPGLRIALEGGDDGDTILMLIEGDIRDDSFYEFAASMVYAGTDVGGIVSTAPSGSGDQVQRIGVAESADAFYFNPSIDVGEVE